MRLVVAAVALAGCYNPTLKPGAPCLSDTDCPTGLTCVEGRCGGTVTPRPDAAMTDAPADAAPDGPPDALIELVIGDDIAELRDAEIWGDLAQMDVNHGTGDHWSIDGDESGLLWFDLSSIPAGSTVVSAVLTVEVFDDADPNGGTATVHRLRESWVETEVTWNSRNATDAWMTAGAKAPSSDTTSIGSFAPMTIGAAYDVTLPEAMVQEWIDDPAINFGLAVHRGTSTDHIHMATRESGVAASRLTIVVY